jgi:hypothetical protein
VCTRYRATRPTARARWTRGRRLVSVSPSTVVAMWPIIGSEEIASGALTRGKLRWNYTAVHPDVYVGNDSQQDMFTNAYAAWLWTRRRGIVAGAAAAAVYGVDTDVDSAGIELIGQRGRPRPGIIVRDERIDLDEIHVIAGMKVTSPGRTALDLARHRPRDEAVVLLDHLSAVTGVEYKQATALMLKYSGAVGIPRACVALELMDGGTLCAEETRLRLMFHDAGLPEPRTGIRLRDGLDEAVIGMGWDWLKVGVSRVTDDDGSLIQRARRHELVQRLGWFEIQVPDNAPPTDIVCSVRDALRQRERRR